MTQSPLCWGMGNAHFPLRVTWLPLAICMVYFIVTVRRSSQKVAFGRLFIWFLGMKKMKLYKQKVFIFSPEERNGSEIRKLQLGSDILFPMRLDWLKDYTIDVRHAFNTGVLSEEDS